MPRKNGKKAQQIIPEDFLANPEKVRVIKSFSRPGKRTKNKLYLRYEEVEGEKITGIFHSLRSSENYYLDFESLFPELQLGSKLIGIYDPSSLRACKLPDLFPFYETILCIIYLWHSTDKVFEDHYGCSYKSFLQLVDMGKVVPLISPYPFLDNSNYIYFKELIQKNPPKSTRCIDILQRDLLFESILKSEAGQFHTKTLAYLMNKFNEMMGKFGINESDIINLRIIVFRPLQRGDIPQTILYLNYINSYLAYKLGEISFLIDGLTDIERWCEQPYVAPGVTLNYTDKILTALKEQEGEREACLVELFKLVPDLNEEALQKFILFINSSPVISGETLALLKEQFFYELPEVYNDPVKYAYSLSKSGNIQEQFRIAESLQKEIEEGRFGTVKELAQDNSYECLIKEINREIQLLNKVSGLTKVSLQFGASILGVGTGALIGQQFQKGDFTMMFSFLGAAAASALMKEYTDPISRSLTSNLFKRSNTAFLIWNHLNEKRNV